MFRIWKYLPTFVFCTFVTIAQEPHHSLLSNGDQSEGIYITQIIRPQIWAQECTCTNRFIKMGPINLKLDVMINDVAQPILMLHILLPHYSFCCLAFLYTCLSLPSHQ